MHVVLVAEQYLTDLETGGGFARSQRQELERRGHTVTVITTHRPDVSHSDAGVVEVTALHLPTRSARAIPLPGLGHVDSLLRRADVVQAYEPLLLGQWAAQRALHYGVPSVYVHHPYQALSPASVDVINQFCAVANPLPSDIRALPRAGVTAPIYPIVYGSAPAVETGFDPHFLHRQLDRPVSVPMLLHAGPLTEEANVAMLVDALLPIQYPLHFVIAGDGPLRQRLEQHIFSRGASQSMHVLPSRAGREQNIYSAATLALSAGGDAHPTWLVEAARRGVPIVAVRSAETEHTVRNRSTGILTEPTKTALTRAVTQLLHRSGLRHRYGKAATVHAAMFSIERSVDQLIDLYALVRRLQHIEG